VKIELADASSHYAYAQHYASNCLLPSTRLPLLAAPLLLLLRHTHAHAAAHAHAATHLRSEAAAEAAAEAGVLAEAAALAEALTASLLSRLAVTVTGHVHRSGLAFVRVELRVEVHGLAVVQRFEAFLVDRGKVAEDFFTGGVNGDETVALVGPELNLTSHGHLEGYNFLDLNINKVKLAGTY